eukprot:XP_017445235.1 PREDICTED: lysoplasmalogenase isoform X2 [Rattus norvegicus]
MPCCDPYPWIGLNVGRLSSFPLLKYPQVRRWLAPFIVACSLYFLLWIPEDQPSWVSALVKCQPILCLVLFLWAVAPGGSYTWLLQGALTCSAVGDACLIWPEAFFYGTELSHDSWEHLVAHKYLSVRVRRTGTKNGTETEGRANQGLPHLGIHHIWRHQTQYVCCGLEGLADRNPVWCAWGSQAGI